MFPLFLLPYSIQRGRVHIVSTGSCKNSLLWRQHTFLNRDVQKFFSQTLQKMHTAIVLPVSTCVAVGENPQMSVCDSGKQYVL